MFLTPRRVLRERFKLLIIRTVRESPFVSLLFGREGSNGVILRLGD